MVIAGRQSVSVLHGQELLKISLFFCDFPAFFIDQFKSETAVGHTCVKNGLADSARNTAVRHDTCHNFRRQLIIIGLDRLSASIAVCIGNLAQNAENIDFVSVSQNIGKGLRILVQPTRKSQLVVLANCGFCYILPAFRERFRWEAVDQAFLEKDVRAQLCMIHRLRVCKCVVSLYLLKTTYVVQQPEQPCKVYQLLPAEASRDALSDLGNPVGMRGFLEDHGIIAIIVAHICVKCIGGLCTIHKRRLLIGNRMLIVLLHYSL